MKNYMGNPMADHMVRQKVGSAHRLLINTLALPIMLLSGILLPMSLAPLWLRRLSDISPFKHMVDGIRAVFVGEVLSFAVALGFGLSLVLLVASLWFGTRIFRKQTQ